MLSGSSCRPDGSVQATYPDSGVQRIPPDGTVEVIFHLEEPFGQIESGRVRAQPACMLVGVWTRPIELLASRRYDAVGIRLKPGAASAFCRDPLHGFTDRVVDATAIWGRAASDLCERLAEAGDPSSRLKRIEEFLARRMRRAGRALPGPLSAIDRTRGRLSIDMLARQTGMGHRRLERAFLAEVGVSAKMLSRIVRFQRALAESQTLRASSSEFAGTRWVDVALQCGYSDQSHLIRDFRQFAGETPATLTAAEPQLADYFRRR